MCGPCYDDIVTAAAVQLKSRPFSLILSQPFPPSRSMLKPCQCCPVYGLEFFPVSKETKLLTQRSLA